MYDKCTPEIRDRDRDRVRENLCAFQALDTKEKIT